MDMTVKKTELTVTCNGSGAASGDFPRIINGKIVKIAVIPGASQNAGADIDITTGKTADSAAAGGAPKEAIVSKDNVGTSPIMLYPRVEVNESDDGAAAAAGDNRLDHHYVNDYMSVAVAGGNSTRTMKFIVYYV